MTSVAYKDGIIASDSACTANGTYFGSITKLARRADGAIAGAAGNCSNIAEFFDWFRRNDGTNLTLTAPVGLEAIMVTKRRKVWCFGDHGVPFALRAKHHGMGSGTKVVLAAMAAGATAQQAVKIACKLDTASRGPVQTMRLGE